MKDENYCNIKATGHKTWKSNWPALNQGLRLGYFFAGMLTRPQPHEAEAEAEATAHEAEAEATTHEAEAEAEATTHEAEAEAEAEAKTHLEIPIIIFFISVTY